MADASRQKAPKETESLSMEQVQNEVFSSKQTLQVGLEQQKTQLRNKINDVSVLFREVKGLIAQKENDIHAQRQLLAQSAFEEIVNRKQDLEGELSRSTLILKGLESRIDQISQNVYGVLSRVGEAGVRMQVKILNKDLLKIREEMESEENRGKGIQETLDKKIQDSLVVVERGYQEAPRAMAKLGVNKKKEDLLEFQTETMGKRKTYSSALWAAISKTENDLNRTTSKIVKKEREKETKQELVENYKNLILAAGNIYQDQKTEHSKSIQAVSAKIHTALMQAEKIQSHPSEEANPRGLEKLRSEVHELERDVK